MARQTALPTKAAVTRAVRGVQAAGVNVGRVEIDGGKIVIIAATAASAAEPATDFDSWRAKRDARPT